MAEASVLAALVLAALASLFMAWAIGAGSSGSTPFAPAVGANAISVMRAGFLVGLLGFAGAVTQGANVSEAVGSGLIRGVELTPLAAVIGLVTAAILVAVGVFAGYPIATAFTVTGAIVGVGLALGGIPAWEKYQQIATLWVLVPFVGGGIAYATARLLRNEGIKEELAIPVLGGGVGAIIANIKFVFFGPADVSRSIAVELASIVAWPVVAGISVGRILVTAGLALLFALALVRDLRKDASAGLRHFLLILGGLVAFSAGGSQVGLAIGPLLPLVEPFAIPVLLVLVFGGFGLLFGSWTGAPRMIKALSQDYSLLGPRRSIAALIPSFAIAQIAVFYGIPVSFNEIIVSAIIGSGYAAGSGGVSRQKMAYTVVAWIGSLALAFGLAYGVFTVVEELVA